MTRRNENPKICLCFEPPAKSLAHLQELGKKDRPLAPWRTSHSTPKGQSVINNICEKRKYRCGGRHRMRSTFVKPRCTALSSTFDAQHFCQVSTRSTFVKFRCTYATHNALQHYTYHSCVCSACFLYATFVLQVQHARRVILVISCALPFALLTMASLHLQKISLLYIKHTCTCSFWGRGDGFKRNDAFSCFHKYR